MMWRIDSLAAIVWRLAVIFALAVSIGVTAPAQAATGRGSSGDNSALGPTVATNVLAKIYQSANARLATGDLEGAVAAFNLIVDVGPGLTEAQFSRAFSDSPIKFFGAGNDTQRNTVAGRARCNQSAESGSFGARGSGNVEPAKRRRAVCDGVGRGTSARSLRRN